MKYHQFLSTLVLSMTFCITNGILNAQASGSIHSIFSGPSCPDTALEADVVAIDHPIFFNRLGAQNVNWMMYALRHDIIDQKSKKTFDYTPEGERLFATVKSRQTSRDIALRPDLRPRPLVLRVAEGNYLKVRFTNLLHSNSNPFSFPDPLPNIDHPTEAAAAEPKPKPQQNISQSDADGVYRIDDQVASRFVGFHPQGLELKSIDDDSSYVGKNTNSLTAPGETKTYCFYAPEEGAFLVTNPGAVFGGEGTAGNSGVGLFGVVAVQPKDASFYRAQVTEEEMRLATIEYLQLTDEGEIEFVEKPEDGQTVNLHPKIDYEAVYPNDCASNGIWCQEGKAGKPILNMVQGKRIIHGDINALIIGPNDDGGFPPETYPLESKGIQNPALPNRLEPFREFVSVFHDENAVTQAFPYFFQHPELRHTLHGVRDSFMINYGSGGIGSEIIANRLKAGPMQDCLDCAYEEFFLSSFAVGDAAMLVDKPANLVISQCQPEFTLNPIKYADEFKKYCIQPADQKATEAYYPHDPANVHHSYIGDFVKFRNLHSGKEQHIFHLHNHQWLFNPNDDNSNYIDAQGIGPGSGYTYEIAYGGSGNRNKTVGDAIFHCHYYPHFAQGMWYMWRNHDVFEGGTPLSVSQTESGFHEKPFELQHGKPAVNSRALPDGEIVAGTPIPAIVPLPGKAMAPMPEPVHVTAKANGMGSKAELVNPINDKTNNPGYPFWIAGVTEHGVHQASIGSRPTTPPLDMTSIPDVVDGWDGGLPRHALAGFDPNGPGTGTATGRIDRFTAEKHIHSAVPIWFPEEGTALERIAMTFHSQTSHVSHKIDMSGNSSRANFETNGAPSVPGAPFNDPCIDDLRQYDENGVDLFNSGDRLLKRGKNGWFFGNKHGEYFDVLTSLPGGIEYGADNPRVYKGANLQLDVVFNKIGYHYPQQRILTLWEDVGDLLDKIRPPEPLVLRMNTYDCAMYAHTNLVPNYFFADDYQITTPTDVIGQHIHLPKWDLTSADGGANGWNYEDGTFSPATVRERIEAISHGTGEERTPAKHPYFNSDTSGLSNHQKSYDFCLKKWKGKSSLEEFEKEYGIPGMCDWLGARTTLQRWFSDPLVNKGGVHRGLGITFTHDHLGPSTHQQIGLYATMLTEPPGSQWQHNETGELLYNRTSRHDGGPTSWQAVITGKDGTRIDVDGDSYDDSHREFFLQFGDFQHAYVKGEFYGVDENGRPKPPTPDSFRKAINPSVRKPAQPVFPDIIAYEPTCPGGKPSISNALPGSVYEDTDFGTELYNANGLPLRPCPEAISADDIGMMVVNYRNEPIGARVYDKDRIGPDGKRGAQALGEKGDLAFAMRNMLRVDPALNKTRGHSPYPELTHNMFDTDPFTPIMRAYSGDLVRIKIQGGAHEHEHNGSINALAWIQGGSGYGQAPHSGWRNSQNTGLSEQFTFTTRITDYWSDMFLNDRMYTVDSSQDGMWNGVWGILRSKNTLDVDNDKLMTLPGNPIPTVLTPDQGRSADNVCPKGAKMRTYHVAAVLANEVLDNKLSVTIPDRLNPDASVFSNLDPNGGTLVYNPRATTISIEIKEDDNKVTKKTFGTGPLHDPTAILFVRNEDLTKSKGKLKLKPGKPVEPLVLRAAAGDCIEVVLHNRLPKGSNNMPDLDGYTSVSGIIHRDEHTPGGSVTTFNNNLVRPSNQIALHPQLVHYNVQTNDGNNIGVNKINTIGPGEKYKYYWYAGVIDMPSATMTDPSGMQCPEYIADDIEEKYELLSMFANLSKDMDGLPTKSPFKMLTPDSFRETFFSILDTKYHETGEIRQEFKRFKQSYLIVLSHFIKSPLIATEIISHEIIEVAEKIFNELSNSDTDFQKFFDNHFFINRKNDFQQIKEDIVNTHIADHVSSDIRDIFDPILHMGSVGKVHERIDKLTNYFSLILNKVANGLPEGLPKNLPQDLAHKLALSMFFEVIGNEDNHPYQWRSEFFKKFNPKLDQDKMRLVNLSDACRYEAVEFGGTNLTPPDRIKQGQKGAIGALVIEPENAFWIEKTIDDTAINRQNPGENQKNKRKTRATAKVFYPTDNGDRFFRDLVMVHQKGLNLRYKDGSAIPNLAAEKADPNEDPKQTAPEDAHDSGHMAINYGAEPMWFRFGLPPDAPFGKKGFGGVTNAWQAFSNQCCNNGGTAISADQNVGDPYVPVMKAYAGQEMRIRSLLPTGVGRASTMSLHGHVWQRDPYLAEYTEDSYPRGNNANNGWRTPSKCIGQSSLALHLGGQESVSPMSHFDLVFPRAGGSDHEGIFSWRKKEDFLWRDHTGYGITNGLWSVVRIKPQLFKPKADSWLRNNCMG